eukprot:612344-Pelagomonas_calceolata.AAC.1
MPFNSTPQPRKTQETDPASNVVLKQGRPPAFCMELHALRQHGSLELQKLAHMRIYKATSPPGTRTFGMPSPGTMCVQTFLTTYPREIGAGEGDKGEEEKRGKEGIVKQSEDAKKAEKEVRGAA